MADIMPSQTVPTGFDPQFSGAEGMIAPGQEELAQQLMDGEPQAEPQAEPQSDLIGGKFNSQEDLLKAYQELERKQSQPQTDGSDSPQLQSYTAEQATQIYGDDIVNSVNEAGLNMAELMWKADQGADISEHYDALASAVGVPRQVVENYVSKAQAGGTESGSISDADEAQILSLIHI